MFDDQRWRDSYDSWKLASPPEYEEEQDEASLLEEDAWHAGEKLTRAEAVAIVEARHRDEIPEFVDCELIDEDDFEEAFGP